MGVLQLLVLACDGVWDVCTNEDVYDIVRALVNEGERSLKLMSEELLDQVRTSGTIISKPRHQSVRSSQSVEREGVGALP